MTSEIKRRFTDTEMQTARETDLPELLTHLGYQVKRIGRYYTTAEMDSLRIKDRRTWFRYSQGIGGDAITFLQHFCNQSFPEAVEYLLTFQGRPRDAPVKTKPVTKQDKPPKEFALPPRNADDRRVFAYLRKRGIAAQVIRQFMNSGSLYEDAVHHNCVFVGRDHTGQAKYAGLRGTYVYIDKTLTDGKYLVREIQAADGYALDTTVKTFYVEYGGTSTITWKNTPITGQIQIVKKSADYNPTNGLPAETLLEGAVFEITDKAGNVVDTIRSNSRGLAVSKQLPLSRYFVREIKAPEHYGINDKELTAYLEYEGQILRFEVEDKSLSTGVAITKTGPKEIVAGQPVRYAFSGIANTSNVSLSNFYWRDTLPAQVRLDTVVTGTYNRPGTYKIVYRVNGGGHRTLADNLSTQKNYTLAASATALKLASNERVTEIMFVFGQAPAGFAQVEKPYLHCKAVTGLSAGSFVNVADVGGTYGGTWVQGISRWVTTVYGKPVIPTLPKTGY